MKKTDDTSNYFQKIADYVRKKRISPMLLSSSEGQILLEWEKKGVPLDIAFYAIDIAFEKFMKAKMQKKRGKFNLKSCKSLVLKEWQNFLQIQEYINEEKAQWDTIIKYIRDHVDSAKDKLADLKNQEENIQNIDEITDRILTLIDSLQGEFEIDYNLENVIENLKKAQKELIDLVIENLDDSLVKEGYNTIDKNLRSYRGKIDEETFNDTRQLAFKSWIKRKMNLPDLSFPYNLLAGLLQ